jgi:hypothetical protein
MFCICTVNKLRVNTYRNIGNAIICSTTFIQVDLVLPYEIRSNRDRNDGNEASDQASKERT